MFVRPVDEFAGSAATSATQQSKKAMVRNRFALIELWGRLIALITSLVRTRVPEDEFHPHYRTSRGYLLRIDQWRLRQLQVDHEIEAPFDLKKQSGFPSRQHPAEFGYVLQPELHYVLVYCCASANVIFRLLARHGCVVIEVLFDQG